MKNIFLFFLLLLLATAAHAQVSAELNRRNGFKDIKLGTPIDSVKGAVYKKDIVEIIREKHEFPAKLYEVKHDDYKTIGEVVIRRIELKTYKNLVYEIVVITDKDTRLMKGMTKSLGEPKYILTSDSYNWVAENLSLTFKDHSRSEIRLTYRSYPVQKMMFADKGKEIDVIADDF